MPMELVVIEEALLGMPGIGGIPAEALLGGMPMELVVIEEALLGMPGIGGIPAEPVFIGGALGADIYI
jgi:hypothetical protein